MTEEDPEIARLLDFARRLEGMNRNVGTHAAGVVIADRPLEELVPLQKLPNKDKDKEVVTTQWEMGDIEKAGLLKMDFLGLRNLTSLDGGGPAHQRAASRRARSTSTAFRSTTPGPTSSCSAARPRAFSSSIGRHPRPPGQDEARPLRRHHRHQRLYRPGPLNGGMVDEYVDVKHGRKQAVYLHPVLKEVLEETYGVMVYQEQVMRILNRLGGIELSQAYAHDQGDLEEEGRRHRPEPRPVRRGAVARGLDGRSRPRSST